MCNFCRVTLGVTFIYIYIYIYRWVQVIYIYMYRWVQFTHGVTLKSYTFFKLLDLSRSNGKKRPSLMLIF